MDFLKKNSKYKDLISSIFLCVFGLLLIIWPGISAVVLCYIIGAVLIINGIYDVFLYYNSLSHRIFYSLTFSIIKIIFGIILIFHPLNVISILAFTTGLYIIINSIINIYRSNEERKYNIKYCFFSYVFAIIQLIIGFVILLFDRTGNTIIIIIGIGMLVNGINILVNKYKNKKIHNINDNNNNDKDDTKNNKNYIEVEAEDIE